jgi:hypothetical protein
MNSNILKIDFNEIFELLSILNEILVQLEHLKLEYEITGAVDDFSDQFWGKQIKRDRTKNLTSTQPRKLSDDLCNNNLVADSHNK